MWRRYSSGSEDILRFSQDMRPEERRKRLHSNEFYAPPETVFEEFGKGKKTIECLGARGELHKEIDVAVRPGFATRHGAEQGEPCNTKRSNFRFGARKNFHRLFSGNR